MMSFLPADNFFTQCLEGKPSTYLLLQLMETLSDLPDRLRTFVIHSCADGHCPLVDEDFCVHGCRWKHCSPHCYNEDNTTSTCQHVKVPHNRFWYMPIRDRVEGLLKSDLHNLIAHYGTYRHKRNEVR